MKPPKVTYQAIAGAIFLLVAIALGSMLPAKPSVASSGEQATKKEVSTKPSGERQLVSLKPNEWARLLKSL
ncbi:MAG: hypothetical protein H6R01_241 [Burkholderiaceae bacterium]|nr:hypothetical protein [Burkholderiaceae bacterium]